MDFEEITDKQGKVTYLRRDGKPIVEAKVRKSLDGWLKDGIDPRKYVLALGSSCRPEKLV